MQEVERAAYGHRVHIDHGASSRLGAMTRRQQQQLGDLVLAACWLGIGVLQLLFPDAGPWQEPDLSLFAAPTVLAWVLTFVLCAPIALNRRFPMAALFVSLTALYGLVLSDYLVGLLPFVGCILIFSVGVRCTLRQVVICSSYVVAGLVFTVWTDYPNFDVASAVRNGLLFGTCLILGLLLAVTRRDSVARLELVEQRSMVANQRAETALVEERLRLAQELHDIVAHSMSVIAVQASMGSAAFDRQPDQTRRALANIEQTSHETLAELRGLLGVLRREDGTRADTSPAPTLRDLRAIVANLEGAGVTVEVVVEGDLDLPPGADAFGYRIVQEALTNVLKHARASAVDVDIVNRDGTLTLRIRDDGRGASMSPQQTDGGHGIIGMHERVATFGGSLQTGPVPGGGFEVAATIPYAPQAGDKASGAPTSTPPTSTRRTPAAPTSRNRA